MHRFNSRLVVLVAYLVVFLLAPATAVLAQTTPALEPLPNPDLTGMEPAVRDLLAEERSSLERLISRDDADPALLADAWGEMGFVYHAHALHEAAAACYRNAQALVPQDFRWPHSLGALERERGRLDEARAALERTLELTPADLPALVYLGDALLSQGNTEQAAEVAQRALQISDTSPAVLDLAGRIAMEQGRTEEALRHLEFALSQVPEADRLHYGIGMAYRALGDLDKAREHLAQAGKIGVKAPDPLLDLIDAQRTGERLLLLEGRRAFGAGDFAAAAVAFRRAVDAEPESLRARVNLASSLAYSGGAQEAVEQLQYVLGKDPDHQEALFNLGAIYRASGNFQPAIEFLTKALAQAPEDDGVREELGLAYRGVGDLENAVEQFKAVAEGRVLDSRAQHNYADTLARLGRYQEALGVLREAYQLQPEDGLLAHGLARLLAACPDPSLRRGDLALDLATRVVQAAPEAGHLETLALALAELGRCAEAADVQRQILEIPGLPPTAIARYAVGAKRYAQGPPCRPPFDPALAAGTDGADGTDASPDAVDETKPAEEDDTP